MPFLSGTSSKQNMSAGKPLKRANVLVCLLRIYNRLKFQLTFYLGLLPKTIYSMSPS
jgi:hypothetical protein